ncbi:LysM peptidoglycan-binding domain-containing M23 family metallopeptidase [Streptomyces sp. NBC_01408]|uniref:M23 family metallopeptidase n=1 Tax=Streptomyces sp. NBC_01408 TaxID=2903855 RepID=UPI002254B25F|nr:LysM peptidoglycan-binding domain-containing M23 family metallopeptidase [Streptomyces sp. NBC_01408]MCX4695906.1 LysM peptidoglycan-binding domain-containing M23 family metallopeptidase [Streptomyces sp. NBC_01408]
MPAKGKHRRPKSGSISRGFAAAGTGGAALALPLMGATGAQAAGAPTAATAATPVVQAVQSAPQAAPQAVQLPAAPQAAPTVYTVVPGDYLSKIAAERDLTGGWERLYADNREAVGTNPSLIHPGLKLTLGAKGEAAPAEAPARPAPKAAPAPEKAAPKASGSGASAPSAPSAKKGSADSAAPAKQKSGSSAAEKAPTGAGFVAPVSGGVSTQYKVAGSMWSSGYHTGVDFIASSGTTVKAVGAGTVVSAGWSGSYGNEVVIRHADGNYSQYAHLSSLSVSSGQSVTAGQRIGLSGSTGNSTGPHLHFEIRTSPSYGSDMDPIAYLRSKGASL